ncbi:MAG: YdjY domain-containing protein [Planctomycetota bacterium]
MKTAAAFLFLVTILLNAPAQKGETRPADRPPADIVKEKAATDALRAMFDREMEQQGVFIDRARKLIALKGKFNSPKQPLEYLITAPRGSHYESLIAIEAKPLNVAAAIISFNVNPGTGPVRKLKEKKPTEEEMKAGATSYEVEKGTGDGVFIYVEWNDDRGFHRNRIEDLVFERTEGRTILNAKFIFTNSMMIEPRASRDIPTYAANADGNFASCGFGGAPVLTYPKPHPYAMDGDFEVYQPNWTLVPSDPLPVTVILSCEELLQPLIERAAPPASAPAPPSR